MIARALLTIFVLSIVLHVCAAVNANTDYFISPPPRSDDENTSANVKWALGSVQTVQWNTTLNTAYTVNLWAQTSSQGAQNLGSIYQARAGQTGPQQFNWTVGTLNNPSLAPGMFFLWLWDFEYSPSAFTCHYFNISAPTTTSSSATTSMTTMLTSTNTQGTTTTAMPAATTSSGPGPSSVNVGAVAGGTVGGVAALAILAAIGWMVYRKKKDRRPPTKEVSQFVEHDGRK